MEKKPTPKRFHIGEILKKFIKLISIKTDQNVNYSNKFCATDLGVNKIKMN